MPTATLRQGEPHVTEASLRRHTSLFSYKTHPGPDGYGSLGSASSHKPIGHQVDSLVLRVVGLAPNRGRVRGNHTVDVSVPSFLSL